MLEQPQCDRDKLEASRKAQMALIPPVRRIPSELWIEIFLLCLPADEFVGINVLEAPLLLGRICSHWREIALSTTALWSSISIGDQQLSLRLAQMPLIEAWLARSGNLPLSIQIIGCVDFAISGSNDLLDIFIPFSSRWYNLDLWLPQPLVEKIVCNNDFSMPFLAILSLAISTVLDDDKPLLFSRKATRLRSITVSVDRMIPPLLNFPWAQITELRSDSIIDIHDCFDIFRLCPQLTHLQLRNISQDPFDGNNRVLARMLNLSWLRLFSHGDLGPLLDNLIVPSLHEIHLEVNFDTIWPKSQLIALASRSSSPFEIFTFWNTSRQANIMEADIVECFESIQTLRDMYVGNWTTAKLYRRRVARGNSESGGEVYEQVSVS